MSSIGEFGNFPSLYFSMISMIKRKINNIKTEEYCMHCGGFYMESLNININILGCNYYTYVSSIIYKIVLLENIIKSTCTLDYKITISPNIKCDFSIQPFFITNDMITKRKIITANLLYFMLFFSWIHLK